MRLHLKFSVKQNKILQPADVHVINKETHQSQKEEETKQKRWQDDRDWDNKKTKEGQNNQRNRHFCIWFIKKKNNNLPHTKKGTNF